MSVLTVTGLSQRFLDKVLYQDASFQVNIEDHLGVICLLYTSPSPRDS